MARFSRRDFLKSGLLGVASLAATTSNCAKNAANLPRGSKNGFTMWQLNTQCNQIGNTYVFLTDRGRVVVMDGGWDKDELYLRGFLCMLGGKVDTWFVSHPHMDHITSLVHILQDPRGISIRRIVHSRFSDSLLQTEENDRKTARELYVQLDKHKEDIDVVDLRQPGMTGRIDGFRFKILGVTNEEFNKVNTYNNSSVIIRVWDNRKSLLFLGDAGVECGDKVLNGPYRKDLDCDYMQMAHHGQNGCSEAFYRALRFKACLWSTPRWVWENDFGKGPGSGTLKTAETRRWMDEKGITEHHVSWQGLWQLD